jgi:hypothetical protein
MAIKWDNYQIVSIANWIEDHVTLIQGDLVVEVANIESGTFAAELDMDEKRIRIFTSMESSVEEGIMNVCLAYILAMAYDRVSWDAVPPKEAVQDCHRVLCESLLEFNQDLAKALEEHLEIVETWIEIHSKGQAAKTMTVGSTEVEQLELQEEDDESIIEKMGSNLFAKPADTKKWLN